MKSLFSGLYSLFKPSSRQESDEQRQSKQHRKLLTYCLRRIKILETIGELPEEAIPKSVPFSLPLPRDYPYNPRVISDYAMDIWERGPLIADNQRPSEGMRKTLNKFLSQFDDGLIRRGYDLIKTGRVELVPQKA